MSVRTRARALVAEDDPKKSPSSKVSGRSKGIETARGPRLEERF
jgi:hypothetical protein